MEVASTFLFHSYFTVSKEHLLQREREKERKGNQHTFRFDTICTLNNTHVQHNTTWARLWYGLAVAVEKQ